MRSPGYFRGPQGCFMGSQEVSMRHSGFSGAFQKVSGAFKGYQKVSGALKGVSVGPRGSRGLLGHFKGLMEASGALRKFQAVNRTVLFNLYLRYASTIIANVQYYHCREFQRIFQGFWSRYRCVSIILESFSRCVIWSPKGF